MMISYAQNFEDVMLARVFGGKTDGFYIDVGAADPIEDSVTKHFHLQGWRGINIEPIRSLHEKLIADRPEDVNLNLALGAKKERRKFFNFSDDGLSTMDSSLAQAAIQAGRECVEEIIEVVTLAEVCGMYAATEVIDFVKIDVEGWEGAVLEGADWSRFRPRVIVVEATTPLTQIQSHRQWQSILLRNRYQMVYFDGLNQFYLREEDAALKVHFETPPNIFDNFRKYSEVKLERQINALLVTRGELRVAWRNSGSGAIAPTVVKNGETKKAGFLTRIARGMLRRLGGAYAARMCWVCLGVWVHEHVEWMEPFACHVETRLGAIGSELERIRRRNEVLEATVDGLVRRIAAKSRIAG